MLRKLAVRGRLRRLAAEMDEIRKRTQRVDENLSARIIREERDGA